MLTNRFAKTDLLVVIKVSKLFRKSRTKVLNTNLLTHQFKLDRLVSLARRRHRYLTTLKQKKLITTFLVSSCCDRSCKKSCFDWMQNVCRIDVNSTAKTGDRHSANLGQYLVSAYRLYGQIHTVERVSVVLSALHDAAR